MPTTVPMQIFTIPNFCGGRILTNFFYYEENQFEVFFKNIIAVLGTTENKGNLGMIVAFTNQQQKVAAGFLERLGFKPVAITDKYGNYNRENGKSDKGNTSPCVTFTGDWYYDVLPKIKEHIKELEALRTTAAATSNLRRPVAPAAPATTPPSAPTPSAQPRDTQFRVGDIVRVMFTNRAFTVVTVLLGGRAYLCRSHTTGNMVQYHPHDLVLVTRA